MSHSLKYTYENNSLHKRTLDWDTESLGKISLSDSMNVPEEKKFTFSKHEFSNQKYW